MFDVENRDERCCRLQGDSRAPQRAGGLVTCAVLGDGQGGFTAFLREILPLFCWEQLDNKDIIVLLGHRWVTGRLGLTVYVQY
jgi:hypothetical protein